jgi:hypothetical protein
VGARLLTGQAASAEQDRGPIACWTPLPFDLAPAGARFGLDTPASGTRFRFGRLPACPRLRLGRPTGGALLRFGAPAGGALLRLSAPAGGALLRLDAPALAFYLLGNCRAGLARLRCPFGLGPAFRHNSFGCGPTLRQKRLVGCRIDGPRRG